jgi:hypothetical protein
MQYLKCYTCKEACVSLDSSLLGTTCPACHKGKLEKFKKNEPSLMIILPTVGHVKNKENPKPKQRREKRKMRKGKNERAKDRK